MATKLLFILLLIVGVCNAQTANVVRGNYDSTYNISASPAIGLFTFQSADTTKTYTLNIIYTPKHYTTIFNDTITQLKVDSYSIEGSNAIINYQFIYSRGETLTFTPITIPYDSGVDILTQLANYIQLTFK